MLMMEMVRMMMLLTLVDHMLITTWYVALPHLNVGLEIIHPSLTFVLMLITTVITVTAVFQCPLLFWTTVNLSTTPCSV